MLRRTLGAVARRWYVVVLVLALASALTVSFQSQSGVYSTRTTVSFTTPNDTVLAPNSSAKSADFIAFAGTVAAEVAPDGQPVRYAESDAPYYGAGLRQGVLVSLLDEGNQWDPSYRTAVIVVQIVGTTEEWVAEHQERALNRIEEATASRSGAGSTGHRVAARVDPLSLRIERIAPSAFAQLAGLGAMALAAVLVAGWAAVTVDRLRSRPAPATTIAPAARKEMSP